MPLWSSQRKVTEAGGPTLASHTARYLAWCRNPSAVDALQLVDCIVADAIEVAASDIHIEPWAEGIVVRFRLAGMLHRHAVLPLELMERIGGRFRVMGDMERFRPVTPQEGGATPGFSSSHVQLRISIFPTKRGEKIVIRLFDTRDRTFRLDGLGLDPDVLEPLTGLLRSATGTILFTGPTGSGKTTAIYACLSHLQSLHGDRISIATVEDPVEFSLPAISQAEITPERDFTYPSALRSLMRQDPQIIAVGEIRDPETASTALQAGLTGHLVLSSVHSPGTAGVFARLLQMGIEPFVVGSSVLAVVGLRLLRVNCPYCRVPVQPDGRWLRLVDSELHGQLQLWRGDGCEHCAHTGVSGRCALGELMLVTDELHDVISRRASTREIALMARQSGMRTLWERGLQRVFAGEVAGDELLRCVSPAGGWTQETNGVTEQS
jgi:type II secretory ATPase GspE/PulE/Tfp pilus assembly ATPase PilB-like protein